MTMIWGDAQPAAIFHCAAYHAGARRKLGHIAQVIMTDTSDTYYQLLLFVISLLCIEFMNQP